MTGYQTKSKKFVGVSFFRKHLNIGLVLNVKPRKHVSFLSGFLFMRPHLGVQTPNKTRPYHFDCFGGVSHFRSEASLLKWYQLKKQHTHTRLPPQLPGPSSLLHGAGRTSTREAGPQHLRQRRAFRGPRLLLRGFFFSPKSCGGEIQIGPFCTDRLGRFPAIRFLKFCISVLLRVFRCF